MNKVLSRTLMLGALVGCMATAAWAGNVEVNPEDFCPGTYEAGAQVETNAAGYYVTGYKFEDVQSSESMGVDANGNIVWCNGSSDYQSFTQKFSYEDGQLTKVVTKEKSKETGAGRTVVETYTYDDQGHVLTHHDSVNWSGQRDERGAEFSYSDHQVKITETYYDEVTACYIFDLDDAGKVVRLTQQSKNDTTGQMDVTNVHEYTYDGHGNLVLDTTTVAGETTKTTYEYDANGLCVKVTYDFGAVEYTYDENGNAVKKVYVDDESTLTTEYTYAPIPEAATPSEFTDVQNTGAYYYDAVAWANDLKITTGVGDGKFAPDRGCSRDQLVTFLWRAAGEPEPKTTVNPFTDVKESDYFYKAVLWAVENGVTTGKSETIFAPKETCTRAQIVTFIYRAAGKPKADNAVNPFEDVSANAYYADAVLWAVDSGITTGKTATRFAPNDTCTRGQGVTFLYRGIGLY